MGDSLSILEVEQQFHHLAQAGAYAEALDLVTGAAHRFPDYSQGGGLAAWLALSGAIPVRGLILVGPFLTDVESVIPLLEVQRPEGLRACLAAGERDTYCLGVARRLAEILPRYGVACELTVYPGLEHNFPAFEDHLPAALKYVTQG